MTLAEEKAKADHQASLDENAAEKQAIRAFEQTFFDKLLGTYQASLDRSRESAKAVQTTASALGTVYTAIIGITVAVGDQPAPVRAIIPAVFLGLALLMSTVYLSYPVVGSDRTEDLSPTRVERMNELVIGFARQAQSRNFKFAYWLRASVVALFIGLATFAVPFLSDPTPIDIDAGAVTLPSPGPVANEIEAGLEAIRYQAQIDIAKSQIEAAKPTQESWPAWSTWVLIGGVVITLIMPFFATDPAQRASDGTASENADTDALAG